MIKKNSILITLIFALSLLSGLNLSAQTIWYNPVDNSLLPIQGRGWNKEIGKTYHRLPNRAKVNVRKPLWDLSTNSAGLYIKFYTDSPEIIVKYQVTGNLSMPHMPSTGVSGLDLYMKNTDGSQNYCKGRFNFSDTISYQFDNLKIMNPKEKRNEYTLYLPLNNEVSQLQIGVPNGYNIEFIRPTNEKPVIVYGTSIAQGACASRPGMAWTNVLQRNIDKPVINLGFSGNALLEKEMFELLSEIDASMYIIDCMPNMTNDKTEIIKERLETGIRILRNKSNAPILLVEHDGYMGYHTSDIEKERFLKPNEQLNTVYKIMKGKAKNLYYMTFEELGLSMDSQTDGIHASDLGMQQYADAYFKKILSIL